MGVNVIGIPDGPAANADGVTGGADENDSGNAHRDHLGFLMYTDPFIVKVRKNKKNYSALMFVDNIGHARVLLAS